MLKFVKRLLVGLLIVFILPSAASAVWWAFADRPQSWREADWGPTGLLSHTDKPGEPHIYVMAARTGQMKGAVSVHSWIVTKDANNHFNRYDKVGWGKPIRKNAYAPAAKWFSNEPFIVSRISGARAAQLIPEVEAAIAAYPFNKAGDYKIYPGPNSNSFVAYVLNQVPELDTVLPSNAVGRDFWSDGSVLSYDDGNLQINLGGYGGVSIGTRHGFELRLGGLVAGVDPARAMIKIPAFGDVRAGEQALEF